MTFLSLLWASEFLSIFISIGLWSKSSYSALRKCWSNTLLGKVYAYLPGGRTMYFLVENHSRSA
jgi:hypothetical protein